MSLPALSVIHSSLPTQRFSTHFPLVSPGLKHLPLNVQPSKYTNITQCPICLQIGFNMNIDLINNQQCHNVE